MYVDPLPTLLSFKELLHEQIVNLGSGALSIGHAKRGGGATTR
jgi:hypothetical protein